jgi:transcriptional regulator with XRE-family HTH domain
MWHRLQKWMTDSGVTQLELARRMEVSQPTVSDWLNEKTFPSTENLIGLSEVTGISLDELARRKSEAEPSMLQAAPAA